MRSLPDSSAGIADIILVIAITVLALIVTISHIDGVLLTAVTVPFLLFAPGYSIIVALFSNQSGSPEEGQLIGIERIVYSIVISIALAVIVGVNLDFTQWQIRPVPIITALSVITLASSAIALYRRKGTSDNHGSTSYSFQNTSTATNDSMNGTGFQLATIAAGIAVIIAFASVALVAAEPQRGETYTEMGLLVENDEGNLVADNYPEEMQLGNSSSMYFTVTNKEQKSMDYVVAIQLAKTAPNGDVIEQSRIDTFRNTVQPGGQWQEEHSVTPKLTGQRLRLTYLLYRGNLPDQVGKETAYREIHIWIDVTG